MVALPILQIPAQFVAFPARSWSRPAPHRRAIARFAGLAIALLVSTQAAAAAPGTELDPARLGRQTFDERFERLDAGADEQAGPGAHRWRTVMGYGGPTAFDNRKVTRTSVAVDRDFVGVSAGTKGARPLGLDPFEITPGQGLTILARPTPAALRPLLWNVPWITGQLTTRFSFSQRYGYFEVEARLPVGKGFWPQFWLMPTSGTWPRQGEIDIFEGLGRPHEIFATVHWGNPHQQAQTRVALPFDVSAGFHRYGVGWDAGSIAWYVDRREVARTATPPGLDRPIYILLGLGVGGEWGGFPDAGTVFPGRFAIRRVSAWEWRQP